MSEPVRIVVVKPTTTPKLLRAYALLGELAAKSREKEARTAASTANPGNAEPDRAGSVPAAER